MTNKEAILSYSGVADAPDNFITIVSADRGVILGDTFLQANRSLIELCIADIYIQLVCQPDFSEGNLTIKISRAQMVSFARKIYRQNGEDVDNNILGDPEIREVSDLW